jgi:hypothetical protein
MKKKKLLILTTCALGAIGLSSCGNPVFECNLTAKWNTTGDKISVSIDHKDQTYTHEDWLRLKTTGLDVKVTAYSADKK